MKNNNPLHLRRTGWIWQGLSPQQTDRDEYQFRNPIYGYRAAFITIRTLVWRRHLTTVARLLTQWDPDADGQDRRLYTARVCALTGFSPQDVIDPLDADRMIPLVCAISRIENCQHPRMFDVMAAWRLYLG
jgi:hypothetical protein